MSAYVDTSIIVRYLTGDPPSLANEAAKIIDGEEELLVTDLVLAETAYVLESVYRVPRPVIADHLVAFSMKENINVPGIEKDLLVHALHLCKPSSRVSWADALIWAAARTSKVNRVYSFDKRFPPDSIEILP
jgi:predicted nucleic acid-binding protein